MIWAPVNGRFIQLITGSGTFCPRFYNRVDVLLKPGSICKLAGGQYIMKEFRHTPLRLRNAFCALHIAFYQSPGRNPGWKSLYQTWVLANHETKRTLAKSCNYIQKLGLMNKYPEIPTTNREMNRYYRQQMNQRWALSLCLPIFRSKTRPVSAGRIEVYMDNLEGKPRSMNVEHGDRVFHKCDG